MMMYAIAETKIKCGGHGNFYPEVKLAVKQADPQEFYPLFTLESEAIELLETLRSGDLSVIELHAIEQSSA